MLNQDASSALHVLVIAGLSGAGKSTVSDALEDSGFFCVDNLPVSLLQPLVEFSHLSGGRLSRLALVVTLKTEAECETLLQIIRTLSTSGHQAELLFLDASKKTLLRRYSETRRRHPLDTSGIELATAIELERNLLAPLRECAHNTIDTTELNAKSLRAQIAARFAQQHRNQGVIVVSSFGFKHGVPRDANLLFDVRYLANPYFVEELREHTGENAAVARFVLEKPEAQELLVRIVRLLSSLLPQYLEQGFSYLHVAIGCTGGKHRSVALAIELAKRLSTQTIQVQVQHRDAHRG